MKENRRFTLILALTFTTIGWCYLLNKIQSIKINNYTNNHINIYVLFCFNFTLQKKLLSPYNGIVIFGLEWFQTNKNLSIIKMFYLPSFVFELIDYTQFQNWLNV